MLRPSPARQVGALCILHSSRAPPRVGKAALLGAWLVPGCSGRVPGWRGTSGPRPGVSAAACSRHSAPTQWRAQGRSSRAKERGSGTTRCHTALYQRKPPEWTTHVTRAEQM